jgi:hypothetical protein
MALVPRFGWPYAVIAVPVGAALFMAALDLRRRPGAASARRLARLSVVYLLVLLGGIVLSSLS